MRFRIGTILIAAALGLGGCIEPTAFGLPERGFVTHAFDGDGRTTPAAVNGCAENGCPQAPGFCIARGYAQGTVGYQRCIASVEENLRKQNR